MTKVFCSLCIIQKISILGDRYPHLISFSVQVEHIWNTEKRIWLFLIILAMLALILAYRVKWEFFLHFCKKICDFLKNLNTHSQHPAIWVKTFLFWKVQLYGVLKIQTWDKMVKNSSSSWTSCFPPWSQICIEAGNFTTW